MEKLKDYWPLITIYLIALGYLYSAGYYETFNLNIFPYLDITDIFQIQFVLYSILFCILFLASTSAIVLYTATVGGKKSRDKLRQEGFIKTIHIAKTIDEIVLITFGSLFLLIIVSLSGIYFGKEIKNGKANREVTIILEKTTVQTDRINIFVGQTKNYIFLYNRINEQTTVYKISDIKELKFSKGIDHSNEK